MGQNLIALIDGENVGFAVAEKAPNLQLTKVWNGKTADYPTFIDALQFYLKAEDLQPREYGFALAVAGVARGDIISLANCRWYISVSGLRSFIRSEPLVINDTAASAWSLTAIDRSRLMSVGSRPPQAVAPNTTFLVVDTSCGMGLAALHVTRENQFVVIEGEGGHGSFAPQNALDDEILAHLRQQFGHVSYERVVSRAGLQNIYRALAAKEGSTGPVPESTAILSAARQRSDRIAVDTMKVFIDGLGSFAGSSTLALGAWDGVFLVGEMLHDLVPTMAHSEFRSRFTGKGRLSKLLERVPIAYVNYKEARLLGAAAALLAREEEAATAAVLSPLRQVVNG